LKIGITLPQAGQQATRENVIQMANLAEEEGNGKISWSFVMHEHSMDFYPPSKVINIQGTFIPHLYWTLYC